MVVVPERGRGRDREALLCKIVSHANETHLPLSIKLRNIKSNDSGTIEDFDYFVVDAQLVEGGVEVILVETIFDTLNAKAAFFAIQQAFASGARGVPIMAKSVSMEDRKPPVSRVAPWASWKNFTAKVWKGKMPL